MAANHQVLDNDFGSTSRNVSVNQHAVLQNEQPITYPSSPLINGEGADDVCNSHPDNGCICGATFSRKDALLRHVNSHSPEVPKRHACDHCGERFHRKDKLKLHSKRCPQVNANDAAHDQRAVIFPLAATPGSYMISNEGSGPSTSVIIPCGVPGCPRVGNNSLHCRIDPEFQQQDVTVQLLLVNGASRLYQLIDEHQTYWQDNAPQFYGQDGTF
ncbi:hypothetical protein F5B19DRAFT_497338 [Rostrohypoxylon terebratum]|nr:hypothetical protein F5B19DRAFT_497338 [Rostrohypoxylon terebratum]